MTSFTARRHTGMEASEDFELRIEKALRGGDTVYILDDGTRRRIGDGIIETTSI